MHASYIYLYIRHGSKLISICCCSNAKIGLLLLLWLLSKEAKIVDAAAVKFATNTFPDKQSLFETKESHVFLIKYIDCTMHTHSIKSLSQFPQGGSRSKDIKIANFCP